MAILAKTCFLAEDPCPKILIRNRNEIDLHEIQLQLEFLKLEHVMGKTQIQMCFWRTFRKEMADRFSLLYHS